MKNRKREKEGGKRIENTWPFCTTRSKREYLTTTKQQLVLLGANDAALEVPVDNQGLPLDQYRANLHRILTHPRVTAHGAKILLVTPPPLDEIRTTELDGPKHGQSLRRTARSAAYSQAAREVAAAVPGTVLVDLHRALMEVAVAKTPGWGAGAGAGAGAAVLGSLESGERGYLANLLPDGLHLSGEAYRVLWDLVRGELDVPAPGEGTAGYAYPAWTVAPWEKKE